MTRLVQNSSDISLKFHITNEQIELRNFCIASYLNSACRNLKYFLHIFKTNLKIEHIHYFSPQKNTAFGGNIRWHSLTLPVTFDRYNIQCSYFVFILHGSTTSVWHTHWPASDLHFDPRRPCLGLCVSHISLVGLFFVVFLVWFQLNMSPDISVEFHISHHVQDTIMIRKQVSQWCVWKNCTFELILWKLM